MTQPAMKPKQSNRKQTRTGISRRAALRAITIAVGGLAAAACQAQGAATTPTAAPDSATTTPRPTATTPVELLLLDRATLEEKITEAVENISDPELKALVEESIGPNQEKIAPFLQQIEEKGIIYSAQTEQAKENLSVSFTNTGIIVVRLREYRNQQGDILFHDYCLTPSLIPGDNNPLIATLEGAKQAAVANSTLPGLIASVEGGDQYLIVAKDVAGNNQLAVSWIDPAGVKTGQWVKISEAIQVTGEMEVVEEAKPTEEVEETEEVVEEEEDQAALEDKILNEYGINLRNLSESDSEVIKKIVEKYPMVQEWITDQFPGLAGGFVAIYGGPVIHGWDNAPITPEGWRICGAAKIVWLDAEGNAQEIQVPLEAYNENLTIKWDALGTYKEEDPGLMKMFYSTLREVYIENQYSKALSAETVQEIV